MTIDIVFKKGHGWMVIAHLTSGDAHDGYFKTYDEAINFVIGFYGRDFSIVVMEEAA